MGCRSSIRMEHTLSTLPIFNLLLMYKGAELPPGGQIRCGDLYSDKAISTFNECAVSNKKCVPQRVDADAYPVPKKEVLAHDFDLDRFQVQLPLWLERLSAASCSSQRQAPASWRCLLLSRTSTSLHLRRGLYSVHSGACRDAGTSQQAKTPCSTCSTARNTTSASRTKASAPG